jgi:hypothetical protein
MELADYPVQSRAGFGKSDAESEDSQNRNCRQVRAHETQRKHTKASESGLYARPSNI